jgi:tetratricopeptide (TPR) repeat protein
VTRLTNIRTTPELPKSETMGGKMGEISFKAPRERGLPRVPASWLLAFLLAADGAPAFAQQETAACAPVIARVVSLQGTVEVQRAGAATWVGIRRLDTSICAGDRLRTASSSRAALFVQPETLVRLDQNTSLTLQQSTDEISVEFSIDEASRVACSEQTCGAGYFITRFPKKFKVKTPHMNAAVEGTEFVVTLSPDATRLTVLEGKVASESVATGDRKLVEAGQHLASGAAGPGVITTTVKPEDAVQWVLRYPPLSNVSNASRAEELLRVGSVDAALAEIDSTLRSDPGDSDALALRSVIQIAKNAKTGALESAERATNANAGNYRAWLARSYAEQAAFDLEAALNSSRQAATLQPGSALAHARVAELQLSLGDTRQAGASARTAIASDPTESHAHSILGFVHLAQIETKSARKDFEAAIERDSFSALPRLGLGLALIREGELTAGREQLEIAVALDPSNSLLRSYVGKAYYDENTTQRDELAATQFAIADTLDPRDPTSRLYDAIRLQTANRPVDALHAIRESIARNDNRAVFRSELKLEEDLAVRASSQGRIFRDLAFRDLAVLEGWQAVNIGPGDFSGHRLLADTYSSVPQHEIARVNELFTSQLLQPLNLTPVPPQLGDTNLFILDTAGPSDIAFNEFNPLFASDGRQIHASGTVAGNDTWGNDLAVAAVEGRWSVSLGQYHFETDGFRANNDLTQDTYNAYLQFRLSERTSFLSEIRYGDREHGDIRQLFDPASFNPTIRTRERSESIRFGAHHAFSAQSRLLASLVYRQPDMQVADPPFFDADGESESYTAEIQHIYEGHRWRLVSGFRQIFREESAKQTSLGNLDEFDDSFDSSSAYSYGYVDFGDAFRLDFGATADLLEGLAGETERVNPKLGLIWRPAPGTQVRLAALAAVQPDAFSRQDIPPRLEPTQVTGFNQVYGGSSQGEKSRQYGVAIDHAASDTLFVGAQALLRELEIPFVTRGDPDFGTPDVVEMEDARVLFGNVYGYWSPNAQLALSARYQYDKRENEGFASFPESISELETHRVPVSARYFHPSGFSVEATATWVDQEGSFLELLPFPPFVQLSPGDDRFWVLDLAMSYRLPRRTGIVALVAENVTDARFRFQDVDPENPEIFPERLVSLKITLAF